LVSAESFKVQKAKSENMKSLLIVSSVLNLALAGCLIFFLAHLHPETGITPAAPDMVASRQTIPVTIAAVPSVDQVKTEPFRWSQLESADYRTYVRNLRNSGCPELTVRAIVRADVNSVYRHDSEEIERKLADLANGSWAVQLKSYDEQQILKAALQKMPAEENSEIAYLLGLTPQPAAAGADFGSSSAPTPAGTVAATASSPASAATDLANASSLTQVATEVATTSPTPSDRNRWQGNPIVYPLVFQKVDLPSLNLNADQAQAVQNLQQSFVDQIGGPNQDTSDPAYRQRWQQAQMVTDNMLRDILGWTGFQNYQIAAQANPQITAVATP
jgi:hypothetical protein